MTEANGVSGLPCGLWISPLAVPVPLSLVLQCDRGRDIPLRSAVAPEEPLLNWG